MIRLALILFLATCSSGPRRTCTIESIKRTRCDAPIDLAELRARANVLVGTRVTLRGPLGETYPWCMDLLPRLGIHTRRCRTSTGTEDERLDVGMDVSAIEGSRAC